MAHVGSGKLHLRLLSMRAIGTPSTNGEAFPNLSFREVENATSLRFNAVIVDCEACLTHVLGDGKGGAGALVDQLDLILLELDGEQSRTSKMYEVSAAHFIHPTCVARPSTKFNP